MSALLSLEGLTVAVGARRLVDRVSLQVERGGCLALVGESGSGKSTVARALVGLMPWSGGTLRVDGRVVQAADRALRRRVQLIFQDPYASLDPLRSVLQHLARPLLLHGHARAGQTRELAERLAVSVGLTKDILDRYPGSLSGGQRQRVSIARALAVEPDVLIADEPTAMLDTHLRHAVLDLFTGLRRERGLGLLLITHDLAAARLVADTVAVLHQGAVVERGPAAEVLARPHHPYTAALVRCASSDDRLPDPPVDPAPAPAGCSFAHRCPRRVGACAGAAPERQIADRTVRCHQPLGGSR